MVSKPKVKVPQRVKERSHSVDAAAAVREQRQVHGTAHPRADVITRVTRSHPTVREGIKIWCLFNAVSIIVYNL